MAAALEPNLCKDLTGFRSFDQDYIGIFHAMDLKFGLLADARRIVDGIFTDDDLIKLGDLQECIREFPDYIHQLVLGNFQYGDEGKRFRYLNILFVLSLMYNVWDSVHDFDKTLQEICQSLLLKEDFQTFIKDSVKEILSGQTAETRFIGMNSRQDIKKRFKEALNTQLGSLYPDESDTLVNSYIFYFIMLITLLHSSPRILGEDGKDHLKYISYERQPPEDKFITVLGIIYDITSAIASQVGSDVVILNDRFHGYTYQKHILGVNVDGAAGGGGGAAAGGGGGAAAGGGGGEIINNRIMDTFQNINKLECIVFYPESYKYPEKQNKFAIYSLSNMREALALNVQGKLPQFFETKTPVLLEDKETFNENIKGLLSNYAHMTVDCCIPVVLASVLEDGGIKEIQTIISMIDGRVSSAGLDKHQYYREAPFNFFGYMSAAIRHRNSKWTFTQSEENNTFMLEAQYDGAAAVAFTIQLQQDVAKRDYRLSFDGEEVGDSLYGLLENLASIPNMKKVYNQMLFLSDAQSEPAANQILDKLPTFLGKFIGVIFKQILVTEAGAGAEVDGFEWSNYKNKLLSIIQILRFFKFLTDLGQMNSRSKDRLSAFGELWNLNKIWGAQKGNKTTGDRMFIMTIIGGGLTRRDIPQVRRDSLASLLLDADALLDNFFNNIGKSVEEYIRTNNIPNVTEEDITGIHRSIDLMRNGDDEHVKLEDIQQELYTKLQGLKETKEKDITKDIDIQSQLDGVYRNYYSSNPFISEKIQSNIQGIPKIDIPEGGYTLDELDSEIRDKCSEYNEAIRSSEEEISQTIQTEVRDILDTLHNEEGLKKEQIQKVEHYFDNFSTVYKSSSIRQKGRMLKNVQSDLSKKVGTTIGSYPDIPSSRDLCSSKIQGGSIKRRSAAAEA